MSLIDACHDFMKEVAPSISNSFFFQEEVGL